MNPASPVGIAELGLAYQVKTMVEEVTPLIPNNPLRAGDVIRNVRVTTIQANGEENTTAWFAKKEIKEGDWGHYGGYMLTSDPVLATTKMTKITLLVERDKKTEEIEITPAVDPTWPLPERGWLLAQDTRRQVADTTAEAVSMGVRDTFKLVKQVFQNLRGILTGRVNVNQIGGPVLIGMVAYRVAGYDFWEFVFFLGMISANLAVVNFLPIPVLDGGHMVFLVYEKLRGKPASETVRVGATYAGLALILSLFIFVMYLDVSRLFS
jgi:regulator of sigma E protease